MRHSISSPKEHSPHIPEQVSEDPSGACKHCGLTSPRNAEFCCAGCEAIYSTIHKLKLDEFYKYRDIRFSSSPTAQSKSDSASSNTSLDYLDSLYSHDDEDCEITLQVEGLHCAGCLWLLERLPNFIDGVTSARLHFDTAQLLIHFKPKVVALSTVASHLEALGYPVRAAQLLPGDTKGLSPEERKLLMRIGVAAFCAMNTMMLAVSLWQGFWSGIPSHYGNLLRWISFVLTLPAITYSAWPFWITSYYSIRVKRIHIDIPIAVSLMGGFLISSLNTILGREYVYFDSVTALITLLLSGRFLQARALKKARALSNTAWRLLPQYATVISETSGNVEPGTSESLSHHTSQLPVVKVTPGMLLRCLPGERIPVDGKVIEGVSGVDNSLLSGESLPVRLEVGSIAHAGALVLDAPITISTIAAGGTSRVEKILQRIAVLGERSPLQTLTDRASSYFVSVILVVSTVVGIWWWAHASLYDALDVVVAMLIVTCPCALGVATPAAMTIAIGRAAKFGMLIRGKDTIERVAEITTVCFDKTGTLTTGVLTVSAWRTYQSEQVEPTPLLHSSEQLSSRSRELLRIATSVTPHHPVSTALLDFLESSALESVDAVEAPFSLPEHTVSYSPGRGVEIQINPAASDEASTLTTQHRVRLGSLAWFLNASPEPTISPDARNELIALERSGASVIVLSEGQTALASFALTDTIHPETIPTISWLTKQGLDLFILSGDSSAVVSHVAHAVGIPQRNALGGLSPEEKAKKIKELPGKVLMVGDGFNDAFAMKEASVGVGIRGAIDSLLEVVDVYVVSGSIGRILQLLSGARSTLKVIAISLIISAFYNIAGAILAACGIVNPVWAAILMPVSSFSVIALVIYAPTFRERDALWR